MKVLQCGLLLGSIYLLSGCVGQPSLPKVDEAEVNKYEKAYMLEYEAIKQKISNNQQSFYVIHEVRLFRHRCVCYGMDISQCE